MPNPLRHLIRDEVGSSAFLATVLDPRADHAGQAAVWRAFATAIGIPPAEPPLEVACEAESIDLLLRTATWWVIVENKVAGASVTRNQLTRYYKALLSRVTEAQDGAGRGTERLGLCVVYLTPGPNVGAEEFESLSLQRPSDRKVHLAWDDVLPMIERAFLNGGADDEFAALVRNGLHRTREILAERAGRAPKTVMDDRRRALERLVSEIEDRVRALARLEGSLKLTRWLAPRTVEVYGGLDGTGGGNVYLAVDPARSLATDAAAELRATLKFKVAGKAPAAHRERFRAVPAGDWCAMLGLPAGALEIDGGKCSLSAGQSWHGTPAEVREAAAATFFRFLTVFRPLTAVRAEPRP